MKKTKLKDICNISAGGTPSRSNINYWNNGDIPWCKIGDFSGKYINQVKENITEEGLKNSSAKIFKRGTILYTIFATVGEVAILETESATNQAIAGLEIINNEVDLEYLYYYLKSLKFVMLKKSRGVAQNNINLGILKNIEIKIPSKIEQINIAKILDNIEKIIHKKKKQLKELNTIIKSQFVEMFKREKINKKGWLETTVGEHIRLLTDFSANGSYKILDSKVIMYDEPNYAYMVRTIDLENKEYKNKVKYITKETYEFLSKSKVYPNDIIMNKIGSAGKVYIMPDLGIPVTLGRNAFLIRFNDNILPIYIYYLLTSDYGKKQIQKSIRGAVTKTITKDDVRKIKISVPPITLQNQFAEIVKQIDKQKFEIEKSLKETQELYESLMEKYFG